MVRTKLDLSGEEKTIRFVLLAMFAASAASILLTKQTGVDYLYYYLPVSDYLFSQGVPGTISPSVLDAPFGYPQAEYLLLGATAVFGDYGIYAIKLVQCLKVAAVFWLSFRLAIERSDGNGFLLPAALIAPSAVIFFSVYSTDINSIIGLLAILLILTGRERSLTLWSLVAYAALSKYTFWLFLPPLLPVAVARAQALRWISLLPLLLILWHLASNLYYFGNPVFPVGARPNPALPDDMVSHLTAWSKPNSEWLLYIAGGFLAGGGVMAILPGLPGFWYAVAGLYTGGMGARHAARLGKRYGSLPSAGFDRSGMPRQPAARDLGCASSRSTRSCSGFASSPSSTCGAALRSTILCWLPLPWQQFSPERQSPGALPPTPLSS